MPNPFSTAAPADVEAPALGATDKQREFVARLTADRAALYRGHGLDADAANVEAADFTEHLADRRKTSALLDTMIASNKALRAELGAAPASKGAPQPVDDVIAGRYAVESPRDGALRFYLVERPTEGKWAGYVFVKVMHSDDETNLGSRFAMDVLEEIHRVGPEACSIRYGREIKRCGVCGRTLTNEASRAAGIGPICSTKF